MSLRRMSRSVFYWQIRSIDGNCIPAVRLRIFNFILLCMSLNCLEFQAKSQGTTGPDAIKKSLKTQISASFYR